LEVVDLQTNLIADIPSGTFQDLAKLTKLYLNRNRLSRLNVGAFEGLSSLTHLFLDNNQLKTLDVGTFDPLRVKVWRIRKLWKKIFLTYIFYY
jgi:Leucine-rich repeat (LRR) protein